MQSITNYLLEALVRTGDRGSDVVGGVAEEQINDFLQNECGIKANSYTITKKGDDYMVDAKKTIYISNLSGTSITNGLFKWGSVKEFDIDNCKNLTEVDDFPTDFTSLTIMNCPKVDKLPQISPKGKFINVNNMGISDLTGFPKIFNGDIYIEKCPNLTSLKGCPTTVCGKFSLDTCTNLTSLKNGPKIVSKRYSNPSNGMYEVIECPITDLQGLATDIKGDLRLTRCSNLASVKGLGGAKINSQLVIADYDNLQTFDEFPSFVERGTVLYSCKNFAKLGAMLKAVQSGGFENYKELVIGDCPLETNTVELGKLSKVENFEVYNNKKIAADRVI